MTNNPIVAAAKGARKGTILMIHGWAQNATVMFYKTKGLTK